MAPIPPLAALADDWSSLEYISGNTNTVSLEKRIGAERVYE
ncbi:hypothetical protein [Fuscovulum blasticum]|nr:hypothetical protein [Fuscovulum blasticum]